MAVDKAFTLEMSKKQNVVAALYWLGLLTGEQETSQQRGRITNTSPLSSLVFSDVESCIV